MTRKIVNQSEQNIYCCYFSTTPVVSEADLKKEEDAKPENVKNELDEVRGK